MPKTIGWKCRKCSSKSPWSSWVCTSCQEPFQVDGTKTPAASSKPSKQELDKIKSQVKAELQEEFNKTLPGPLSSFAAVLAAQKELAAMKTETMSVESLSSVDAAEISTPVPKSKKSDSDDSLARQLEGEDLDERRARLTSIDRQIAALKGVQDSRSISITGALKAEAKIVRNAITLKKPADER
eukprot:10317492-Karenia_brevis.AAC.1